MKYLAIISGKLVLFFGHIFHRGSSFPGKLALFIDKDFLSKLKYPDLKIVVTGSSGKGATSKLIANVLKDNDYTVCFNESGSNLSWGCTTALLKNMTITGKIKAESLVLEVDERNLKRILPNIKPTYLVITNLTKDQPPRQYHIDNVYNDIKSCIPDNTKIITNMDEPYLRKFAIDLPNEIKYFSLTKTKYSYKTQIFENLNTYYCPICHEELIYKYYNFETLGNYHCSKCNFSYNKPSIIGKNLDLEKETIEINNNIYNIGGDCLYNAYNTIASIALLKELSLNEKDLITSVNKFNETNPKYYSVNNKVYYPLSCKSENASTFNQAIYKIYLNKEKKDIIIGWKCISLRYPHHDLSWIYDVEFELINNNTLNNIYAIGIDKENIKKRLILAGIPESKIITANSINDIKEQVKTSEAKYVFGIVYYDYIELFNASFKEE